MCPGRGIFNISPVPITINNYFPVYGLLLAGNQAFRFPGDLYSRYV